MDTYKVTLFGHRDLYISPNIEKKLYIILTDLIRKKPYIEFYIGRNGCFDIFAASIIKRAQRNIGHENSEMILTLYRTEKNIEYYEKYYDNVIIPECVSKVHPKGAITKRNKWMIEESNLLICYVKHKKGGAYTALKYATALEKDIINLATD